MAAGTDPDPGAGGANPQPGAGGANPQPGAGGANPQPSAGGADPQPGAGGRWAKVLPLGREIIRGTLANGYIHAGNIAYLSLVTLMPFAILVTAATAAFGQTEAGRFAIDALLNALPGNIARMFRPVIGEVLHARTGKLLWVGGAVALWTVSTFVETLRDIGFRAFGVERRGGFLLGRLKSVAGTLAAIAIVVVTFLLQLSLAVLRRAVESLLPLGLAVPRWLVDSLGLTRVFMPLMLFLAIWALLKLLTPPGYRHFPSWPGAIIICLAWGMGALAIGPSLAMFHNMDLTYGALSGVMLALLFFYVLGFALVLGVHTNAVLAAEMQGMVPSRENIG